jgi:hypothetical protein
MPGLYQLDRVCEGWIKMDTWRAIFLLSPESPITPYIYIYYYYYYFYKGSKYPCIRLLATRGCSDPGKYPGA